MMQRLEIDLKKKQLTFLRKALATINLSDLQQRNQKTYFENELRVEK